MLDDDFGVRIQALQLSNKPNAIARITVRIFWISEDNRKLRDDAKPAYAGSQSQSILGGEIFVHLLENLVRPGFGAEKDHGATGPPKGFEGGV
jgi:hypothetical protein